MGIWKANTGSYSTHIRFIWTEQPPLYTSLIHFFTVFKELSVVINTFLAKIYLSQPLAWTFYICHLKNKNETKNQNPTIKITFNYIPFILYTPGSLTEVAKQPKPNARYVSERKGSSSPTTKGALQLSWKPLPPKPRRQRHGTMWWNGSGARISCLLLRNGTGKAAKRGERGSTSPFHGSSPPRLSAVRLDAAFTAHFWLVWFYWLFHMVITHTVSIPTPSLQKCWSHYHQLQG